VGGRDLAVPQAGRKAAVARFTFDDLCGRPLGAADYLGVATTFHTVFVTDIPQLDLKDINQVRRFITLVDAFYEKHVKLVVSAAAPPDELFIPHAEHTKAAAAGTHNHEALASATKDEVFAWDRTVSRLNEMSSHEYLIRNRVGSEQHRAYAAGELAEPLLLYETSSSLSRAEALQLFRAYDVDASGLLEPAEVRLLLEDLCERRSGHRNVPDALVEEALMHMDMDRSGEIDEYEFLAYFAGTKAAGLNVLAWGGAQDGQHAQQEGLLSPGAPRAKGVSRAAGSTAL